MEQWKPIVIKVHNTIYDYTGIYEVSNIDGKVRNVKTGRILKQPLNSFGYPVVRLSKDGKARLFKVHRLVATAFVPNPDNLPEVNHKDEDKTNNSVDNLEWSTHQYNSAYSKKGKPRSEETKQKQREAWRKKRESL